MTAAADPPTWWTHPLQLGVTSHGSTAPQVFAFTDRAPPGPGGLDPLVFGPEPRVKNPWRL